MCVHSGLHLFCDARRSCKEHSHCVALCAGVIIVDNQAPYLSCRGTGAVKVSVYLLPQVVVRSSRLSAMRQKPVARARHALGAGK